MDCAARAELRGHAGRVVALLAHPARPLLVSGGFDDYTVRLWDLDAHALLCTLAGHGACVWGLSLDPGGTRLASGSLDSTVRLWDLESGEPLRTLRGHDIYGVYAVTWDAAGARIASGSSNAKVCVWDAASGALLHTLAGHSSTVCALAAHPDAERDLFASGSEDTTVRLWRFSGAHVRTLAGHARGVRALAASSEWLLSGSSDRSLRVWSWDGICARVLETAGELRTNSLAWRGSRLVAIEYDDKTVRVWDTGSPDPSAWSRAGSPGEKAWSECGVATTGGRVIFAAPGGAIAVLALRAPRERRRIRRPAARL